MEPQSRTDTLERREETARHVLHAYRERRRRRRGEDTYFGSADCLLPRAGEAGEGEGAGSASPALERRRSAILEDAEEAGMPAELAELLYDIAQEEGLDPGLAFELVRCGLGVAPPSEGLSTESAAPATDKYLPAWMFPSDPPDKVLRERMLRMSFRRLRSLLEQHDEVDEAFRAFAREPDVGHYGY